MRSTGPESSRTRFPLSVLYAEDHRSTREAACALLERLAARVHSAEDGASALKRFRAGGGNYDLVITDIDMPDMDGLELARQVKEINPETGVVLLSALEDSSLFMDAFEAGVDRYLLKPLDLHALFKLMEEFSSRKMRQTALDKHHYFCRHIIEDFSIVFSVNRWGEFTFVNGRMCKAVGYRREALYGKHYRVLRGEAPEEERKTLWTLARSGRWQGTVAVRTPEGNEVNVDLLLIAIDGDEGRVREFMGIGHDVSELAATKRSLDTKIREAEKLQEKITKINRNLEKKIRKELAKSREKDEMLLHHSKLAAMGEMVSMIAHQWRQPLSAIVTVTGEMRMEMLLGGELEKERVREELKEIDRIIQHLSATIEDFRHFSNTGKIKQQVVLADLVRKAAALVENGVREQGVRLSLEVPEEITLKTHPNEVNQVLVNILKNALDALGEKRPENPWLRVWARAGEKQVTLEIADNGGGVPEKIREKIFDPYFSTKGKVGTGLGLYMSKIIVEKNCGGKLAVENREWGAVFTVKLPKE